MLLRYEVRYYDAVSGQAKLTFEADRIISHNFAAPEGEVAFCQCINGDPADKFWVNDQGEQIAEPAWAKE